MSFPLVLELLHGKYFDGNVEMIPLITPRPENYFR